MRDTMRWLAVAAVVAAAGAAPAVAQDEGAVKTVTATGEGTTYDKAKEDALRKAVEQGVGVALTSRTETLDSAVAYDQIITRSEGYVKTYTEQEKGNDKLTGMWKVTLVCEVSTGRIQSDWAGIQELLAKKGKPSVVVLIRETIRGQDGATVPASTAFCAQALEQLLIRKGFTVKSVQGLQEKERRARDAAVAEQDIAKLAAYARDFGANIMIGGDMTCRFDKETRSYGDLKLRHYIATATLSSYRTDTADVMASVNVSGPASSTGDAKAQEDALKKAAAAVSDQVLKEILNAWYFEGQSGQRFEVEVTIRSDDAVKMRKADGYAERLQQLWKEKLEGVKGVTEESFNKSEDGKAAVLKLSLTATLSVQELKSAIGALETPGFTLERTGGDKSSLRYTLHIE